MITQKHFHTIIIGAGPGGLSCATHLAKEGKDVLILERNKTIGRKICAGGVTWSGLARHLPEELIERQFKQQHIHSTWQAVVIKAPEPIISTINRETVGKWMAKNAADAGAILCTNQPVVKITENKVHTKSFCFTYDYLVGADGSNSMVRRFLNVPTDLIGVGIHYHLQGHFPKMVWDLDPDLFKSGYAWIFPHKNRVSVGAYVNRNDLPPKKLRENLHYWMKKQGMDFKGLKAEAGTINFDYRGWHFGNTFLVGDAAGLASGLTGEGIYPAVLSGETVAKTILDPAYHCKKLNKLIKKQRRHTKILTLRNSRPFVAKAVLEILIIVLRLKILSFKSLEMGD